MTEPEFVKVLARDVVPYLYGVWSSVADGDPFANQIVHMKWSEDSEHLWFGLETHNTVKARPDEVLELVEMSPLGSYAKKKADEWVLPPRPKPKMDQLLDLVGDGAVPPHKWSYCPYCGVEAPRPGLHKQGCPAHDKGGS